MRGMEIDLKGSLATLLSHLGREPKEEQIRSRTLREIVLAKEALQVDSCDRCCRNTEKED
jgi:hypothetical protein